VNTRRLAMYVTLTAISTPALAQSSPARSSEIHQPTEGAAVAKPSGESANAEGESNPPSAAEPRPRGAEQASVEGAFLPFTIGPSTAETYGRIISGYDGAREDFVYEAFADAHVIGGLAIRAGYLSSDLSGHASALLGARFQFLSQERQGLDMAAGLFYMPQDLDGEGLVKARLLLGRNVGVVRLFANVGYGQDPEADDGQAELAMGLLLPTAPSLLLGLDARGRARVFSTDEKHTGIYEPIFDVVVGPVAHYVLGPLVLTSHAGWSSVVIQGPQGAPQPTNDVRNGVSALASVGFAL